MHDSSREFPETWLDALARIDAYPGAATPPLAPVGDDGPRAEDAANDAGVRRIDTHISHVFLVGDRVYKLRRPVRLAFLDFSSRDERLADCLREVRLNRRLAPDVYLGIAPLLVDDGRALFGPVAEEPSADPRAVEHAVVMRRLADGRDLRRMLERGEATVAHIDRVAERLASFHAAHGLGRPAPFPADEWSERTTAPARANFDALAAATAASDDPDAMARDVEDARRRAEDFVQAHREDFERRRLDGRVVDAHGDLHAEHVWFERDDSPPLMIDCLEFRDDFRRIDAASDVAFLAMDLTYRGRADLAARLLRRYARASRDYHLFSVVDYFLSYRAMVRAKVAALVATDASLAPAQREHAAQSLREHLALGLRFLASRPRGGVVLVGGSIGTGKSTVAEALADATGGVVLSSDHLRGGRLGGDRGEDPTPGAGANAQRNAARDESATRANVDHGAGRYGDEARRAVYERLLAEAVHVVASGRLAILDATWSRRVWRNAARAWAGTHAAFCTLVHVTAEESVVLERLRAREAEGRDASEAGPALYAAMRAEFEEPDEWPGEERFTLSTTVEDWHERVGAVAARISKS